MIPYILFPFDENAVSNIHETMLAFREGQPPVFRMYSTIDGKSEDWLAALSEQKTEKPGVTQIVSLNGNSYCVQDASALATRSNPGFSFSYKTCGKKPRAISRETRARRMWPGSSITRFSFTWTKERSSRRINRPGKRRGIYKFVTSV